MSDRVFLGIDYDEGISGSYRAVTVLFGGEETRFETGDPVADWKSAVEHALTLKKWITYSSSMTHFVFDEPDYRYDENDMLEKI